MIDSSTAWGYIIITKAQLLPLSSPSPLLSSAVSVPLSLSLPAQSHYRQPVEEGCWGRGETEVLARRRGPAAS